MRRHGAGLQEGAEKVRSATSAAKAAHGNKLVIAALEALHPSPRKARGLGTPALRHQKPGLSQPVRALCASSSGGVVVRSQIPAARIPGFRSLNPEEAGEAGVSQGPHLWAAAAEHAGDADGFPLRRVRRAAGKRERDVWAVSEVRVRTALVQAVRALRSVEPVRMQPANTGKNFSQGQAQ